MSEQRITVSAEGMTGHALLDALSVTSADGGEPLQLSIEPAPADTRMLDPTIVAAVIGAGGTSLGAVVGGLFALAHERSRGKVVIQGSSGARLEVPATATPEELDAYIEKAKALDVVHLHLAGRAH